MWKAGPLAANRDDLCLVGGTTVVCGIVQTYYLKEASLQACPIMGAHSPLFWAWKFQLSPGIGAQGIAHVAGHRGRLHLRLLALAGNLCIYSGY